MMRSPRDLYTEAMDRDPSGLWASAATIVASLIALAAAFGFVIPPDAEAAILRIVAVAGPLVVGLASSGRMPGQKSGAYAPRTVHEMHLGVDGGGSGRIDTGTIGDASGSVTDLAADILDPPVTNIAVDVTDLADRVADELQRRRTLE